MLHENCLLHFFRSRSRQTDYSAKVNITLYPTRKKFYISSAMTTYGRLELPTTLNYIIALELNSFIASNNLIYNEQPNGIF